MTPDERHSAEAKYLEAMSWLDQPNGSHEAHRALVSLIESYPEFENSYSALSWLYRVKLDNPQRARELCEQGLKLNPQFSPLIYHYVYSLLDLKDYTTLETFLESVRGKNEISLGDWFSFQGDLNEGLKKYKLAWTNYKLALKNSNSSEFSTKCRQAMQRLSEKSWLIRFRTSLGLSLFLLGIIALIITIGSLSDK